SGARSTFSISRRYARHTPHGCRGRSLAHRTLRASSAHQTKTTRTYSPHIRRMIYLTTSTIPNTTAARFISSMSASTRRLTPLPNARSVSARAFRCVSHRMASSSVAATSRNGHPRTHCRAGKSFDDGFKGSMQTTRQGTVAPPSLATWTSISGAAFTTGTGRGTTLPLALFMGLTNIRLGYWWDSGILRSERPGRYPLPLWRKLKRLPAQVFGMQSMLFAEWWGLFRGPGEWFWYLSDGGHFEVTGLYELLRRRVPFVILSDGGEDPDYTFGDLAQLTQQVRLDFGADIEWCKSEPGRLPYDLPDWIQNWIRDPSAIGPITGIQRSGSYPAAFARVRYAKGSDVCWILMIKPSLGHGLSQDISNHAASSEAFPQDSTFDQVFDDKQWESYRALGQQIGLRVLQRRAR